MQSTNPGIISSGSISSHGVTSAALSISTTNGNNKIDIDDCFLQYMELISKMIGLEISYENFSKLSNNDRIGYVNQFIRGEKLDKLGL